MKTANEDYVVINKATKQIISVHADPQDAWKGWQNAWMPLTDNRDRDAIRHGKYKSMKRYL